MSVEIGALETMKTSVLWICVVFLGALLCLSSQSLYRKSEGYLSKPSVFFSSLNTGVGKVSLRDQYQQGRIISIVSMIAGGVGILGGAYGVAMSLRKTSKQ